MVVVIGLRFVPLAARWKRVSAHSVLTLKASCDVTLTAFSGNERACSDLTHSLGEEIEMSTL